jgi:predicted deacylase
MDARPVRHATTDRRLGRLPSGETVSVTVHRYEGGDGPTVYVQSAQHGIELNGPATLRRLHDTLTESRLAGTVVTVPVANPPALNHRSYLTPPAFDALHPNQNRVWPGDESGSLQERLVARLWPLVAESDAVVDLHTGTAEMLTHVRVGDGDETARRLGDVFGVDHLLVDDAGIGSDDAGGDAPTDPTTPATEDAGTLRHTATRRGIPALTVELGNSRTLSQSAVDAGVAGLRNVLAALDVLAVDPDPGDEPTVLRDSESVRTDESGLVEFRESLSVGDRVTADETLGVVYDPATFRDLTTVRSPTDGVVYSLSAEAVTVAGERVVALATPTDQSPD